MGTYERTYMRLKRLADLRGLVFNPDSERVETVVRLMSENMENHGLFFCPCKGENDPPIEGVDPLCPCDELAEEISSQGHCYGRLFYTDVRAREAREQ